MTLRDLYRDNGANGDNVRDVATGMTWYDTACNPVYCVGGWPHLAREGRPLCARGCGTSVASHTAQPAPSP